VAAASKGLGLATARALATEGARVAICGRSKDSIEKAASGIGAGAVGLVADVSTPDGARQFVVDAREALGGLDVLVTNAGGPPPGNFETTPFESYSPALDLNLLSVVAMCQEAVPGMQAQRFGRVVAITSISVRQPIANLILSNTARAGATAFLKTLAREVSEQGVTVNSVQPGSHWTKRIQTLYPGGRPQDVRMGDADDFGAIVAFLCSEQAKYLTGAQVHVDGGAYQALQ